MSGYGEPDWVNPQTNAETEESTETPPAAAPATTEEQAPTSS